MPQLRAKLQRLESIFFYGSGYWRTEENIHTNTNWRAGVVLVISDNKDFKSITVIEDKGQNILMRGSLHQEDTTIKKACTNQQQSPKTYWANTDRIEGKIWWFYNTVWSFNASLSVMDRTFRDKKSFRGLEQRIKQLNPIDIHITFQQQNTCFSQVRIEHSPW